MEVQPEQSDGKPAKLQFKHYAGIGSLVAAIAVLNPVKQMFFTREEGAALEKRIDRIESDAQALSTRMLEIPTRTELTTLLTQSTDRIIQSSADRDKLTNKRIDLLDETLNHRLDSILQQRSSKPRGE